MGRTYLFVPPEDNGVVKALGALWDGESKRWYVDSAHSLARWGKWLSKEHDAEGVPGYEIISDQASVAAALVACQECGGYIEGICIHCETGMVSGEFMSGVTVSNISGMDEELARQMLGWPHFRRHGGGNYCNWCPRCGGRQVDLYLHSEPGDAFFDITGAPEGAIRIAALAGTVRLNGDEHFQVDG